MRLPRLARRSYMACCTPALMVWFAGSACSADTIRVPTDQPTLQSAIDAAQNGDVIVLAGGVYSGTFTISGKSITLDGAGVATLDGGGGGGAGGGGSVLTIEAGAGSAAPDVTVRGLTIRNGVGTLVDSACWPFGPSRFGGGVRIVGARVVLSEVRVIANTATLGGGVWYEAGASVTLERCELADNVASEIGAAVGGCWFSGPGILRINASVITRNSLITSGNRYGIITPSGGELTITGTRIVANFNTLGVVQTPQQSDVQMRVSDCIFEPNQRLFGAVTAFQPTAASSVLVERTTFTDVESGEAGGRGNILIIAAGASENAVRDCVFNRSATAAAEAFLQRGGSLTIERCRMNEIPSASVQGLYAGGARLILRDVQAEGGYVGMPIVLRDGGSVLMDRVSMRGVSDTAISLNMSGGTRADLSSVLAAEATEGPGIEIQAPEATPGSDGIDNFVVLTNVTLSGNASGLDLARSSFANVTLVNSIVAGNLLANIVPASGGDIQVRYTLVGGGGTDAGNIVGDPRFVSAYEFGSATPGDYRLRADSPALDAGDSGALGEDSLLDLDGRSRRIDDPAGDTGAGGAPVVDLGAYERGGAAPAGCNVADIASVGEDGLSGSAPTPDAQLTVDDLIVFVNVFSTGAGCPGTSERACNSADVTSVGGQGAAGEVPDGQLTVDDLVAFVNAFSTGC